MSVSSAPADQPSPADLNSEIEHWLTHQRLAFPASLERRFETETGPERARAMSVSGLIGCATLLMLWPFIAIGLRDVLRLAEILYIGVAFPSGLLVAVAMRFNPPPRLRESLQVFTDVASALCIVYLLSASRATTEAVFVSTIMLLVMFSTIGVQMRFAFAAATTTSILASSLFVLVAARPGWGHAFDILPICTAACFAMLANARLERGLRQNYVLALRERLRREDLSERNQQLDQMVCHDALTELANRRAHDASLATVWEQARLTGTSVGFIILDIDNFKAFNDHYGHPGGDACLRAVAGAMRDQLRGTSDMLARLGGEEFAVLLPGLDEQLCADIAERVRSCIADLELPHAGLGAGGMVTISAGVASLHPASGVTPSDLFAAADAALYQAKRTGRNRVCVGGLGTAVEATQVN